MDLSGFNVRAVPHTAAKAQQQTHSLHGTDAWLHNVLQEGEIGCDRWQTNGLTVRKDHAYTCYEDFSKRQRDYRPETKPVWSRKIRAALGLCLTDTRTGKERTRSFQFKPLADCRQQFATHIGAPNIEWEPENDGTVTEVTGSLAPLDALEFEWEPDETEPDVELEPAED